MAEEKLFQFVLKNASWHKSSSENKEATWYNYNSLNYYHKEDNPLASANTL